MRQISPTDSVELVVAIEEGFVIVRESSAGHILFFGLCRDIPIFFIPYLFLR